jgi:ABC-2 type transport system permease protein
VTVVLLRLRFALMAGTLGKRVGRLPAMVFSYALSAMLGIGVGGLLALSRDAGSGVARGLAIGIPAMVFLGWLLGPLMTLGLDSTVDPLRLAPFPLTHRQITVGLFLVACFGGGGLFTLLTVAGLAVAVAPAGPGVLIVAAAGLMLLGTCVSVARVVSVGISVAGRRTRDTLIFVVPVAFMVVALVPSLIGDQLESGSTEALVAVGQTMARAAAFLPSGPAGEAIAAAARGQLSIGGLWLVPAATILVLSLLLWSAVLKRLLTRAPAAVGAARVGTASSVSSLYPSIVSWLPRTRWGAVAAKDLRLAIRDPRQRSALIGSAFGAVPFAVIGMTEQGGDSGVLRAAAVAFFVGANSTNLYAFDAASHWMNVAAGDDARSDLLGKAMTRVIVAMTLTLFLIFAIAAVSGAWSLVGNAFILSLAGLGLGLGPALWVTVRHPAPLPPKQRNIFANSSTGQGFSIFLPVILITLVGIVVLFGLGALLASRSVPLVLTGAALAVAVGGGTLVGGYRLAVSRSAERQPELLASLSKPA